MGISRRKKTQSMKTPKRKGIRWRRLRKICRISISFQSSEDEGEENEEEVCCDMYPPPPHEINASPVHGDCAMKDELLYRSPGARSQICKCDFFLEEKVETTSFPYFYTNNFYIKLVFLMASMACYRESFTFYLILRKLYRRWINFFYICSYIKSHDYEFLFICLLLCGCVQGHDLFICNSSVTWSFS
jgi:hypothetical protein